MSQNAGLTTIHEDDIVKHVTIAQNLITKSVVVSADEGRSSAPIAGTRRRFVSTVSTRSARRAREVTLSKTIAGISADDPLMTITQHMVLSRVRRGLAVALAMADLFAKQSELETLQSQNTAAPLSGDAATRFKGLLSASSYIAAFTLAAFVLQSPGLDGEPVEDVDEPDFSFDTPLDGLRQLVAALDEAIDGVDGDETLKARVKAFARTTIDGLLTRRSRFDGLADFAQAHIRIEQDDFTLNGFDVAPGERRKPLEMSFKKPTEIIGNHIAKYQAMKLAKMLMAYDFDRQMNPFVELGGFLFTFIGDGMPGTGKTILIQMIAGLVHEYSQIAGYPFHYENFGVDQISSYQGKSGQNCKSFIDNVINPRAIGLGTIDDIDQIAARRSDDRASAGQHEVTAVLMESFAGASTVVRGNCAFGMFSNYPENVDDALRQRAGARWLVDGPQSRDDYVDIFVLLAGDNHEIALGEHDLFAGQEINRAIAASYEGHDRPKEEKLIAVWDTLNKERGALSTMSDIGEYLFRIKQAEPRFTGRAIKNITDAIKMRAMDIDLPDVWFEAPEAFMHKPYDEKKAMIEELRGPFSIDMVVQEINRYADSEFRYTDRSDDAAVEDIIKRERQREKAVRQMESMKRDGRWQT